MVERNLTTVCRQEPWLASPPRTRVVCGPRVRGRVATIFGAEPWSVPILSILVTLQYKEDNIISHLERENYSEDELRSSLNSVPLSLLLLLER